MANGKERASAILLKLPAGITSPSPRVDEGTRWPWGGKTEYQACIVSGDAQERMKGTWGFQEGQWCRGGLLRDRNLRTHAEWKQEIHTRKWTAGVGIGGRNMDQKLKDKTITRTSHWGLVTGKEPWWRLESTIVFRMSAWDTCWELADCPGVVVNWFSIWWDVEPP